MKQWLKKRPDSIFKRFFVFTSLTVLFALLVTYFILILFLVNYWKNDRYSSLSQDALSLARSVDTLYDSKEEDEIFDISESRFSESIADAMYAIADSSVSDIFIVSTTGDILLCEDRLYKTESNVLVAEKCDVHRHDVFNPDYLYDINNPDTQCFTSQTDIFKNSSVEYFAASVPLYSKNGDTVCYLVSVQAVADAYLPYTTQIVRMLIVTSLFSLSITFFVSLAVSLKMVKPLKKMTATTKDYARGDFSERISSVDTYKELEDLVISFNSMADSLALTEKSRSGFVANVSHELKTPMTIISGFIDGILDGTISNEDSDKYLQIVSDETKRLSRLVIAMLNMSKIEAGKLTPTYSDVYLDTMLCRTILGFEKMIEQKKIRVEGLDLLPATMIKADEALINQVIYNLIDNAVKFTPPEGTITITLQNDKKTAVFSVRNSGTGIPKEDCGLVFDRFYKVDKSRGLDTKSFGMGLYIVKSIIDLHKGNIVMDSDLDLFTQFTVALPLDCEQKQK